MYASVGVSAHVSGRLTIMDYGCVKRLECNTLAVV